MEKPKENSVEQTEMENQLEKQDKTSPRDPANSLKVSDEHGRVLISKRCWEKTHIMKKYIESKAFHKENTKRISKKRVSSECNGKIWKSTYNS